MSEEKKTYANILVRWEEKVGIVQLNRPKAYNALNRDTMQEVTDALQVFDADEEIGCMIVTGNEKAFAAGADIKQMSELSAVDMMTVGLMEYWDKIHALKKPTIAAVSGWCLGGGCELAMVCDMIVASESAKFGQPEITIGIIPGGGGTQRLTRSVGKSIAMEMVLNNRHLSAEEAQQYGLVNRVASVDDYLAEAITLATEIANQAPVAVQLGKEAVNRAFESSLAEGLLFERRLFAMLFSTLDQKEGMSAFIEKRSPQWQGK